MTIHIGSPAPNSEWDVAWRDGAAAAAGDTISIADCAGKIVVLLMTKIMTS